MPAPGPVAVGGAQRGVAAPPPSFGSGAPALSGGSEVYCISPDGSPRKVWSHAQDVAYALAFDKDGHALIGTGNKGVVYRLDSDIAYTLLVNAPPTQITVMMTALRNSSCPCFLEPFMAAELYQRLFETSRTMQGRPDWQVQTRVQIISQPGVSQQPVQPGRPPPGV